jgi:CBS domain containing-hemolysin-like protein
MGPSLSALLLLAENATHATTKPGLSISLSLTIVGLLLAINGFFVALEFALVALRKTKIDEMVKQQLRGALSVKRGKDNLDDFVAAAQLGITIASLALGMVAEDTVLKIINGLNILPRPLTHDDYAGFFISIAVVTVFHVVIGEQVPKMVAVDKPEKVALLTAPLAEVFLTVCRPGIWALSKLTSLLLRPLGVTEKGGHHTGEIYSEEEIQSLLITRQQAGQAEPQEIEMISHVFHLFEMVATEIMIPRTEMVCIPATANIRQVMEIASSEGHDRYPVFGQNTDEIVGILFMKDLVSFLGSNPDGITSGITSLWREALFVPGSLPCAQLLTQMREKRTRLAIVLDEYGGTAGMLTLGDVLARIVGDLDEASEEEEPENIVAVGENLYSISGLVLTRDVEKFFEVVIDDELNDTIGGVVFSHLGRAPEVGDDVSLEGLTFRVDALDGMRIDRLLVNTSASPRS